MHVHQLAVNLHRASARVAFRLLQFNGQFLFLRFEFRDFLFQCSEAFLDFLSLPRTRLPLLGFNPLLSLAVNLRRTFGGTSSTNP